MSKDFFINNWNKNKLLLEKNHIYKDSYEHSSCGVGLIASLNGKESKQVVEMGVEALKCLYHRGAIDADGKTGDGAGIQLSISKDFFKVRRTRKKFSIEPGSPGFKGYSFCFRDLWH